MKTIEGYRKVDGKYTRWKWVCKYCGVEEDEIRTRQQARNKHRWHVAHCDQRPDWQPEHKVRSTRDILRGRS